MKKISVFTLLSFLLMSILIVIIPINHLNASTKTISADQFNSNQTVFDNANMMTKKTINDIEKYNQKLLKTKNKPQIYIITVNSLNGKDIVDFGIDAAEKLKIKDKTNFGMLTIISKDDRLYRTVQSNNIKQFMSVENNEYHLEKMNEYFRSENYDKGIRVYMSSLSVDLNELSGLDLIKYQKQREKESEEQSKQMLIFAGVTLFIMIISIPLFMFFDIRNTKKHREDLLNRSQYNYRGSDKIYPGQYNFVNNDSWSDTKIKEYINNKYKDSERYKKAYDYKYNSLKSNNTSDSSSDNLAIMAMLYAASECNYYGNSYTHNSSSNNDSSYISGSASSSYSSSSYSDSSSSFSDGGGGGW